MNQPHLKVWVLDGEIVGVITKYFCLAPSGLGFGKLFLGDCFDMFDSFYFTLIHTVSLRAFQELWNGRLEYSRIKRRSMRLLTLLPNLIVGSGNQGKAGITG